MQVNTGLKTSISLKATTDVSENVLCSRKKIQTLHISVVLQADETHSTQTYQITDSHEQ